MASSGSIDNRKAVLGSSRHRVSNMPKSHRRTADVLLKDCMLFRLQFGFDLSSFEAVTLRNQVCP